MTPLFGLARRERAPSRRGVELVHAWLDSAKHTACGLTEHRDVYVDAIKGEVSDITCRRCVWGLRRIFREALAAVERRNLERLA